MNIYFSRKHYQPEMIMLTVRWYLRYSLSFRDLVEMMDERGLSKAHTTIMRWVHQYGPDLNERVRRHLKPTNDSWRVESKRSMDVFVSCSRFRREYD